jgi:hypothetical protein
MTRLDIMIQRRNGEWRMVKSPGVRPLGFLDRLSEAPVAR